MARFLTALLLGLLGLLPLASDARNAAPAADDPVLEAHMLRIAGELRCLVCQNQTLADSHADLAEDLRNEVRAMLREGKSDEQIVRYMTDRYGDFVRYRPPLKTTTVLLWFGPAALLLIGVASLLLVLHRRAGMSDDRFEADIPDPGDTAQELKP
ncbi:cytochrome c-type biogenesis protein [Burkholderia alba]|uniref:cytochrome c-type biogenesis protein n=1 Tax=Burkholderia alba TaxID=2683677 RepID=UPI002B06075B|nr:cytochrome c-type biogenesis protein [Burkholderia alba]